MALKTQVLRASAHTTTDGDISYATKSKLPYQWLLCLGTRWACVQGRMAAGWLSRLNNL